MKLGAGSLKKINKIDKPLARHKEGRKEGKEKERKKEPK